MNKLLGLLLFFQVGFSHFEVKADQNHYSDWYDQSLNEIITKDFIQFTEFHHALVKVTLREDLQNKKEKDYYIFVKTTYSSPSFIKWFSDLFPEANALDSAVHVCYFGGWPSIKINGLCRAPWVETVRRHPLISDLNNHYVGDNGNDKCDSFQNEAGVYRRCNPVLFGPGGTKKSPREAGICVFLPKNKGRVDYSNFTESCYELATKKNINRNDENLNNLAEIYKRLKKDDAFRKKYIRQAMDVLEFCRKNPKNNGNTCTYLLSLTAPALKLLCTNNYDDRLSVEGLDNLSTLWRGIRHEMNVWDWGLTQKMDRLTDTDLNNDVFPSPDIKLNPHKFNVIPKMQKTIEAIKSIAGRKCRAQSISSCRDKKAVEKSWGMCWRHVKLALIEGGVAKKYISSKYAYEAHKYQLLENAGFCNLKLSDPREAPIGTILVYEKTSAKGGVPGHIEIKTGENEFASDFINSRPISEYNGARKLRGTYVPGPCSQYR